HDAGDHVGRPTGREADHHAHRFRRIALRERGRGTEHQRDKRGHYAHERLPKDFVVAIIRARIADNKKKSGVPASRSPEETEMAARKLTRNDLSDAGETYKNWGK